MYVALMWQARSKDPEGILQNQPRGSLRMEIKCEPAGSESLLMTQREQIQSEHLRDSERKCRRVSSLLGGLEFSLKMVVWCTCPLWHPGTGRTRTSAQVSSISHLCPGGTGLESVVWKGTVLEDSKEIINSMTFTRSTYTVFYKVCVRRGVEVLARTEAGIKQYIMGPLQFPCLRRNRRMERGL